MSLKVEYSGHWYRVLINYLSIQDDFTVGEKLAQIEKTAKKRFIDMSDEEIYKITEYLATTKEYFKDERLTDEEFNEWRTNVSK